MLVKMEETIGIIKLNASNYGNWKPRMEDILYVKHLYQPITLIEKAYDIDEDKWKLLHLKAIGMIR